MLSIRTDLSSLIVQNSMGSATNKLNQAIERMTTGAKLNHAKDNAANYSIATNMLTKISAYDVAADNTAMGMDMIATAEGALSQIEDKLARLRALATQANNGTYGGQSLSAINTEANALSKEIRRLVDTTEYNGIKVLNSQEIVLPDHLKDVTAKAEYNGFIADPVDYTQTQLDGFIELSTVSTLTSGETYTISTAAELRQLSEMVNDGQNTSNVTFVLEKDIDLENIPFTPIGIGYNGVEDPRFKGVFNGNGHIISNLNIDEITSWDYCGLFGYVDGGMIKNVGIKNGIIDLDNNALCSGLLAAEVENSQVENCFATGKINTEWSAGGLVWELFGSTMENCYADVDINVEEVAGGLVSALYSNAELRNSFSNGNVVGRLSGALVGTAEEYITISNCYSTGSAQGRSKSGFIGEIFDYAPDVWNDISDCVSYSKISGNDKKGGFIGNIYANNPSALTINNCQVLSQNLDFVGGFDGDGSAYTDIINNGLSECTIPAQVTNLQVGIYGNENSSIALKLGFDFGMFDSLEGIDLSNASVLSELDEMLNLISAKQTELGSVSNRLESVLDEILIQHDNLVSSRSTIRDADIAEVSSQYIQQQILQQASATLLSTSKNIQYQNVLGLLQSLR